MKNTLVLCCAASTIFRVYVLVWWKKINDGKGREGNGREDFVASERVFLTDEAGTSIQVMMGGSWSS